MTIKKTLCLSYHPYGIQQVSSYCPAPLRLPPAPPVGCASYHCQPLCTLSSPDPRDLQFLQSQDVPPPAAAASQIDAHPWEKEGNEGKIRPVSRRKHGPVFNPRAVCATNTSHWRQYICTAYPDLGRKTERNTKNIWKDYRLGCTAWQLLWVMIKQASVVQQSTWSHYLHDLTNNLRTVQVPCAVYPYRSSQLWLRWISRTLRPKPTSASSILLW